MAVILQRGVWDSVVEQTKVAQDKGIDPSRWAELVTSNLHAAAIEIPSIELAELMVSYICWDNNVAIVWKFLERAMALKLVPDLLVLALLSNRVISRRRSQPAAYRLFLELLKRHAFTMKHHLVEPHFQKVMKSVDSVLHLSELYGPRMSEPGIILVEFIFSMVWQLVDASLDDEGVLELTPDKKSIWPTKSQEMELDVHERHDEKRTEYHEKLRNLNSIMAVEMIVQFLQNKVTSRILYLASQNRRTHWQGFVQRIQLLGENSVALKSSKFFTAEALLQLVSESRLTFSQYDKTKVWKFDGIVDAGPLTFPAVLCHGVSLSGLWLPLDLVLEDAMDGYQVSATSAIEIITGLVKTLQAMNGSNWHNTFLGLWIAALRLVQRERDPIEGPIPRLDTRLSMLLSVTPLVIANLMEEEESVPLDEGNCSSTNHWKEKIVSGKHRNDLVTSLQVLGDFQDLLAPPLSLVSAANQAAAKAMLVVSGFNLESAYYEVMNMKEMPVDCSGNMRHLIVEACIARSLLDTSAYLWPGYVKGRINQIPHSMPAQVPGWSSFIKGAALDSAMVNALIAVPASSLAELEKIFEIAVEGLDDEKISAATVLCGASLLRGYNVQEHTVQFITRLLSPPILADQTGGFSHVISYAPMLNVLIVGIGSVDCIQIFSLHGMVPQLACSLMPICEEFGSYVPNISWTLPTGEEISAHAVFSNAFTLLLKLWRFNHPPIEHGVGDIPTVGSQLTPEYLLLVRNSHLVSSDNSQKDRNKRRLSDVARSSSSQPMFVESFPKVKVWYRQHLKCIAASLSGLSQKTTVHRTVEELLYMMFRKIIRGTTQPLTVNSGSSSSSGPGTEEMSLRPKLPAWDILEAVPYVVDAALTACAHGRLSPRELATGLKDLADYLPASLATIVSYFSSEVSRGVWKPAFMNGMDWPSPAANLSNVEEYIKKILAATGVDVPSLAPGGSTPATLPLPLAAFVSLTITYKIDKASERFLNLAGPALESLAAGCPWPCMPIVASLWTQKAKRWFDFLVFSASRTVFLHNRDAVVQLIRSCFTATLGLNAASMFNSGGVGALLGHGFGSHFCGGISPVAPGILYLRMYRSLRDTIFVTEEILSRLVLSVQEIAQNGLLREQLEKLKTVRHGIRYQQTSLATAVSHVKLAALLGASLVWLTGGLGVVQLLMKETLPSWFLSVPKPDQEQPPSVLVAELRGYALAYFMVSCGAFCWGVDSTSSASKRRPKMLGVHLEFVARVMDGRISIGCDERTWRAYVSGFVSLMVSRTRNWVGEMDVEVVKRLSHGLRQWEEDELALALLEAGGPQAMGLAVQLVINVHS